MPKISIEDLPQTRISSQTQTIRERRIAAILNGIQIAIWMYLIFLAARLAYAWLFSHYEVYDDEGYIAVSQSTFFKGMPLYNATFSQYGPIYYLFSKIIYAAIHGAVTTDSVRFTTLGHWLAASLLCSFAVLRLTRRLSGRSSRFTSSFFISLH